MTGIEAQVSGLPCFFSKNITEEVKISNITTFLPIDIAPRKWAKAIIANTHMKRAHTTNPTYNIMDATANLANTYIQLYNQTA